MEIYKREVGYEDLGQRVAIGSITAGTYITTATTLYFPVMLTQNYEDIGIYTDTNNPVYQIIDFRGLWDLSNTGTSKICLTLNNCQATFQVVPITTYGGSDGQIQVLINGCPSSCVCNAQMYEWTGPNGFKASGATIVSILNLKSGIYGLKITDIDCNVTYLSYYLPQPSPLYINFSSASSHKNSTSPGGCDGEAELIVIGGAPCCGPPTQIPCTGGLHPYDILWYSGTTTGVWPNIQCNLPNCVQYPYQGAPLTLTGITGLCAGVYTALVTDCSGTTVSQTFTITEPMPLSGIVLTHIDIACNSGDFFKTGSLPNGMLNVKAVPYPGYQDSGTGPYTYYLSGGTPLTFGLFSGTTGSGQFNNLPKGDYIVYITDSNGNTTSVFYTLTEPSIINISTSKIDVTCYGFNDGIITGNVTGGIAPYDVAILTDCACKGPGYSDLLLYTVNTSSSYNFIGLDVGDYWIRATDNNGCFMYTPMITIQEPYKVVLNGATSLPSIYNGYNLPCYGGATGLTYNVLPSTNPLTNPLSISNLYLIPQGSQNYNYFLDGLAAGTSFGPPAPQFIVISAGTHTITVADSSIPPCTDSITLTITQPPMALSITTGQTIDNNTFGIGYPKYQGIIDVNGGVQPYHIVWSDGSPYGLASDQHSLPQTLTVTVTDANGCTITATLILGP